MRIFVGLLALALASPAFAGESKPDEGGIVVWEEMETIFMDKKRPDTAITCMKKPRHSSWTRRTRLMRRQY